MPTTEYSLRRGAPSPSFETAQDCVVAGRIPMRFIIRSPGAADAMAEKINKFGAEWCGALEGRNLGSCSTKVFRSHAPFRHCQRWRRSFTVTVEPCAGKSCR